MQTKATVLIIEDEENIADFIATSLRAQNYKAVSTRLGKEGIALAASCARISSCWIWAFRIWTGWK